MATRRALIEGIGEVTLSKRRGAKHIRVSVSSDGRVRVSVPTWVPYGAGVAFAKSRQSWLLEQLAKTQRAPLVENARIGKAHRLVLRKEEPASTLVRTRVQATTVIVTTKLPLSDERVQKAAFSAAERALRVEAQQLLPQRLKTLATKHNLEYSGVSIKKLTSRWGSCSNKKHITLNYYLMQLPWNLIDYVLIHELAHTEHMNHSPKFWKTLLSYESNARQLQKEIRAYNPRVEPI